MNSHGLAHLVMLGVDISGPCFNCSRNRHIISKNFVDLIKLGVIEIIDIVRQYDYDPCFIRCAVANQYREYIVGKDTGLMSLIQSRFTEESFAEIMQIWSHKKSLLV